MKVILKKGFEFIPEWEGNKKKKKEDQIKIHFKFLTGADFENLIDNLNGGKYSRLEEFKKVCFKIDNLMVEDETGEREATADDLIEQGSFMSLYLEAKSAYQAESVLGTDIKKK